MDNEISTELDRSLQSGGEKSVVDANDRISVVAGSNESRKVGNPQQRIARCLDPEELRSQRPDQIGRRVGREIREEHFEMSARGQRAQNSVGAAVTVVRRKNQIAGANEL